MKLKLFRGSIGLALALGVISCGTNTENNAEDEKSVLADSTEMVEATIITDSVEYDTDDPAIWIHPTNLAQSLIVGTDKDSLGGLFVFNLDGKIVNSVKGIKRPNNVDIEYGLMLAGKPVDIAVAAERQTGNLRVFSLPDMKPVDGGGLPVFVGDTLPMYRDLMGIGLYKSRAGKIYAIAGRKTGPTDGTYLAQYELMDNGKGIVAAKEVRRFGNYSVVKEIEAIFVDDKMGYVYYSDENVGIRKYYADPEKGNEELALFGTTGFTDDHEGISMYATSDSTGFILVSDQQAQAFRIFTREGSNGNPHDHVFLKTVKVSALESDGSEMIALPLGQFTKGLFVAMSTDKTFHYFKAEDILNGLLKQGE
jgi:3-phytase